MIINFNMFVPSIMDLCFFRTPIYRKDAAAPVILSDHRRFAHQKNFLVWHANCTP